MNVHVFAGPTIGADRIRELVPDAVPHPPVKRGDLLRLALRPGDVALTIDGVWHQSAPIRHKDILAVLADGVTIVGALRTAELAPYGMVGVGRIFEDFRAGRLDADDEVASAGTTNLLAHARRDRDLAPARGTAAHHGPLDPPRRRVGRVAGQPGGGRDTA
ncbi:TfuA-like protein [Streptomyces sp. NPDC097617]|uniref:TfuA-like protein n=1 Tax=Streptomyces sp. NPDC097617 TaxID=3366091 RepID=UPI0038280B1C